MVGRAHGVWMWVWCFWQAQPLNDLCWDEVLLTPTIDNELQWSTVHPHLWVEETLTVLYIFRLIFLDLGGGNNDIGFYINDFSPYQILDQSRNMRMILKLSGQPSVTIVHDIHLCCEWFSCETHTTFLCLSLSSHCYYFLLYLRGCLGLLHLGSILFSMVLGWPCLALYL